MVKVLTAMEVNPFGIFKDSQQARVFNKEVGEYLRLYAFRTTLNMQQLLEEFFKPGKDGHYLEKCCGKGNVVLEITEPSMFVVQAIIGNNSDKNYMSQLTSIRERDSNVELSFYKVQSILNIREVESIALSSHKTIFVQNFGEVHKHNLAKFKELYFEGCNKVLPEYIKKISGAI